MRTYMRFLVIGIMLTVCCAVNAKGNPGFVVTYTNDTIHGEIITPEITAEKFKYCVIKPYDSLNLYNFIPNKIKSYFITSTNEYFISRKSNGEMYFFQCLFEGVTDLYYLEKTVFVPVKHVSYAYYIDKKNGEGLIELKNTERLISNNSGKSGNFKNKEYIGVLKYVFADANELQMDIENSGFHHKSMVDISEKYHNLTCNDENCMVYIGKENSEIDFYAGLLFGYSFSKAEYVYNSEIMGVSYSEELVYGIGCEFSNFLKQLPQVHYTPELTIRNVNYSFINRGNLSYRSIRVLPLKFEALLFPHLKIHPKFGGGIGLKFHTNYISNNAVYVLNDKTRIDGQLTAGLSYDVSKKFRMAIDATTQTGYYYLSNNGEISVSSNRYELRFKAAVRL